MEKNVKKYTPMFEDQEILTDDKVKESMDYMMAGSEINEIEQSDEVYINSMFMQEVIMNTGINEFIDMFVSEIVEKGMEDELYGCLMNIAEEQNMSIDSMYMDNLEATIDVMNYDNTNMDSDVDDYDMAYKTSDMSNGINDMDYSMSYNMPYKQMESENTDAINANSKTINISKYTSLDEKDAK